MLDGLELRMQTRRKLAGRAVFFDWVEAGEDYADPGYAAYKVGRAEAYSCGTFMFGLQHGGYALWDSAITPQASGLSGDLIGALVDECGKRDLVFGVMWIGTVPGCAYQLKQHPDWLAQGPDGSPRNTVCYVSPYRDYVFAEVEEVVSKYPIDIVYFDQLPVGCWCGYCRAKFQRLFGRDLPGVDESKVLSHGSWGYEEAEFYGGAYGERVGDMPGMLGEFVRENTRSFVATNRQILDRERPGTAYLQGKLWSGVLGEHRAYLDGALPEFLWWWTNNLSDLALQRKITQKYGGYPCFDEYKHDAGLHPGSFRPFIEAQVIMAQAVANRNPPLLREMGTLDFDIHHQAGFRKLMGDLTAMLTERLGATPLKHVALLHSHASEARYRDEQEPALQGINRLLMEHQIPYQVETEETVEAGALDGHACVLVPDSPGLTDATIAAIRSFVEAGGGAVIFGRSGLFDPGGDRRRDAGMGALTGARYVAMAGISSGRRDVYTDSQLPIPALTGNAYGMHYARVKGGHAIAEGLENALLTFGSRSGGRGGPSGWYLECEYAEDCQLVAEILAKDQAKLLTQPYNRRVMWPGRPVAPLLSVREIGQGRVAYFAGSIADEELRAVSEHADDLILQAIRWAASGDPPVMSRNVTGSLRLEVDGTDDGWLLNLTNVGINALERGSVRWVAPLADFELGIRTDGDIEASAFSGQELTTRREGARIWIHVPRVAVYEQIRVSRQ